jgi:hypothetical protein
MLLGDAAGYGGADRAHRNVDRARTENARQIFGTERHRGERVIIGKGSKHHFTGRQIG